MDKVKRIFKVRLLGNSFYIEGINILEAMKGAAKAYTVRFGSSDGSEEELMEKIPRVRKICDLDNVSEEYQEMLEQTI
jgi:hypothetical protein